MTVNRLDLEFTWDALIESLKSVPDFFAMMIVYNSSEKDTIKKEVANSMEKEGISTRSTTISLVKEAYDVSPSFLTCERVNSDPEQTIFLPTTAPTNTNVLLVEMDVMDNNVLKNLIKSRSQIPDKTRVVFLKELKSGERFEHIVDDPMIKDFSDRLQITKKDLAKEQTMGIKDLSREDQFEEIILRIYSQVLNGNKFKEPIQTEIENHLLNIDNPSGYYISKTGGPNVIVHIEHDDFPIKTFALDLEQCPEIKELIDPNMMAVPNAPRVRFKRDVSLTPVQLLGKITVRHLYKKNGKDENK